MYIALFALLTLVAITLSLNTVPAQIRFSLSIYVILHSTWQNKQPTNIIDQIGSNAGLKQISGNKTVVNALINQFGKKRRDYKK